MVFVRICAGVCVVGSVGFCVGCLLGFVLRFAIKSQPLTNLNCILDKIGNFASCIYC